MKRILVVFLVSLISVGSALAQNEVAEKADTIVWTIFTGLGPRLPRLY